MTICFSVDLLKWNVLQEHISFNDGSNGLQCASRLSILFQRAAISQQFFHIRNRVCLNFEILWNYGSYHLLYKTIVMLIIFISAHYEWQQFFSGLQCGKEGSRMSLVGDRLQNEWLARLLFIIYSFLWCSSDSDPIVLALLSWHNS